MAPCRRVGGGPHWRGPGQRELHLRLRHSDGAQSGSQTRVKGRQPWGTEGGSLASTPEGPHESPSHWGWGWGHG